VPGTPMETEDGHGGVSALNGVWYVIPSASRAFPLRGVGSAGDIPVPGDYLEIGRPTLRSGAASDGCGSSFPAAIRAFQASFSWGIQGRHSGCLGTTDATEDGHGVVSALEWRGGASPISNRAVSIYRGGGAQDTFRCLGTTMRLEDNFAFWRPSEGVWFIMPGRHPTL